MTETNTKRESMLKKVRALLDKAESTTFGPERDAFLAKADDLMLRHAIAEAELASLGGNNKREDPEVRRINVCTANNPLRDQLAAIITAVARHNRSKIIFSHTLDDKRSSSRPVFASIVGFPSDLDYIEMVYTSLTLQLANELEPKPDPSKSEMENVTALKAAGVPWSRIVTLLGYEYETEDGKPTPDRQRIIFGWRKYVKEQGETQLMNNNPKSYQRSYADGFVYEVSKRLRELKARQDRDIVGGSESSTALVLRDRKTEVDRLYAAAFPNVSKGKAPASGKHNEAGWSRGTEAGRRADLGQRRVAQRRSLPNG